MSRFFAGALHGWCGIIWSARGFRDDAAIRSVLFATAVAEAIDILISIAAALSGTLNALGWLAVAIYAFGTVGCTYFAMAKEAGYGLKASRRTSGAIEVCHRLTVETD
jgi:hypothetical protein